MNPTASLLQTILDGLSLAVIVADTENNILVFNRAAREFLSQEPESRIGSSVLRCHPEASEPAVQKMIDALKDPAQAPHKGWVNFQGRLLYETISALRDENGEWIGTLLEMQDAADRAELLKRLGEWEDVRVSGVGENAPPSPHPEPDPGREAG